MKEKNHQIKFPSFQKQNIDFTLQATEEYKLKQKKKIQ